MLLSLILQFLCLDKLFAPSSGTPDRPWHNINHFSVATKIFEPSSGTPGSSWHSLNYFQSVRYPWQTISVLQHKYLTLHQVLLAVHGIILTIFSFVTYLSHHLVLLTGLGIILTIFSFVTYLSHHLVLLTDHGIILTVSVLWHIWSITRCSWQVLA